MACQNHDKAYMLEKRVIKLVPSTLPHHTTFNVNVLLFPVGGFIHDVVGNFLGIILSLKGKSIGKFAHDV
jgi:hypothetical protein